ncbi:hypothetical protein [Roseateles sp. YR242]|uniref:hypothetical protein n=1 Tax=Roseateles sp. YR242 TaxID=1855305 RepID=UPI001160838C|nr:hypothetical protein [Roseateles sp. YR242]
MAVASLCPAKVHSPASSRVAVSLQAHTPPNLESAQAAPQMLDGWLQPAPPSRVQATADPVSRKRPLGPDQPGEGPSGIKRGAPILRQLPEALPRLPVFLESPAPHRQDHARSLRPWRADLLTNDPRHQFESAQAAADPVSRKRPLVPEQAQPSSLRHWQRELLKAVPPVTTQTRSAHARRLILETKRWPVPMLTEDLMTMSGVGYSMAQAVRKLTNLPQLQILMRQHEQRFRESDRDYARRLLGKGARADALNAVFHLTLKDLVSEAPRAKVVGVSLQTSPQLGAPVSGADTSADRSGQRTVQGLSGVALRTAAGGGEWPPNQPLQQWHRELLALEPPAAVGALESPMGHARRLALLAYPVRGLLAPEDLSWMAGIDLVDAAMVRLLPERKALSALLRQHRQQPWESDLQYIVRIQAEGVERQDVKYLYKVSRHGLPQSQWNLPEAPLLSSLPPSRDHPDPAWGQARPLLPWQQTLLRDFPRGLVETASAHARRLVLKVDRWPGPVLAQDIEAMTGVGSCVARNIRKLVDFPELRRLMGQYPQDFRESDRDYARRLAEHAAPPTDLCCVFSMALSQLFPAPTQDGASVLREPPVPPQPGEGASGTDTAIDRSDKRPVQGIPGVEERTDASSIVWRRNQPLQSWQQALLTLEPPPAPGSLESSDGHARRLALAAYRGKGVLRVEDLMLMANIDWAAAVRERLLPLRKHLPTLMRTYRQQPSESDLHYARRLKREGATSRDLKFVFRVNADQLLEASSGPLTLPKSPSHRPTHWRPTLPGPSENSDRSMLAEGGYTGPPAEPSTAPSVSGPSPDAAP